MYLDGVKAGSPARPGRRGKNIPYIPWAIESLSVASSIESDPHFLFLKLLAGNQTPLRTALSSVPSQASPGPGAPASLFSHSLEMMVQRRQEMNKATNACCL